MLAFFDYLEGLTPVQIKIHGHLFESFFRLKWNLPFTPQTSVAINCRLNTQNTSFLLSAMQKYSISKKKKKYTNASFPHVKATLRCNSWPRIFTRLSLCCCLPSEKGEAAINEATAGAFVTAVNQLRKAVSALAARLSLWRSTTATVKSTVNNEMIWKIKKSQHLLFVAAALLFFFFN